MTSEVVMTLKTELEALSHRAGKLLVPVKPFQSLDQIEQIDPKMFDQLIKQVQFQSQILKEVLELPPEVDKNRFMFRRACQSMGLHPVDDIESKLDEGDIVEIYAYNWTQQFHNFTFHKLCSHDVLTLMSKPFPELYSRPDEILQAMFKRGAEILEPDRMTEPWDVPFHYIKEVGQKSPKLFGIDFKWLSPLHNHFGQTVAVVSTNRCTPVELSVIGKRKH